MTNNAEEIKIKQILFKFEKLNDIWYNFSGKYGYKSQP